MIDENTVEIIKESEAFLPEIGRGTGWRPEPADARDYRAKQAFGNALPPAKASLREHVPPVRDQGSYGSCTGFAGASAVGTLVRRDSGWETIYSPQWLYNLARAEIGEIDVDYGAYLRDTSGVARKAGVARERDFPYYELQDSIFQMPPSDAYDSARSWKLGAHYRCATLNDVKRAISQGHPVVLGFLCYTNLWQANETGLIPAANGSITGGHAVLAAEYDDASRTVSGPNSWSKFWGDNGWYHLPYSFFEQGLCSDMWAYTAEAPETTYPRKA